MPYGPRKVLESIERSLFSHAQTPYNDNASHNLRAGGVSSTSGTAWSGGSWSTSLGIAPKQIAKDHSGDEPEENDVKVVH
jgi:hypothetical protein